MNRIPSTAALALLLLPSAFAPLAGQELEALPRELELELARSALPQHLREEATVYALDPDEGFVEAVRGSNGFHALVVRNDPAFVAGDWEYREYRNDILAPIAFDEAGRSAQMQVLLDVATERVAGTAPQALRAELRRRFATGHYGPPARTSLSYMLSPILRAYRDASESDAVGTFSYPHYMISAPGVSNEDIGGNAAAGQPFVIEPGPHGYVIVPVGRAEAEAIRAEHARLLDAVCALAAEWCVAGR